MQISIPFSDYPMDFITLLGIAVALAMDAFAVSIAVGVGLKQVSIRQTFRLSWHFGLFQALMPLLGWSVGLTLRFFVEAYNHWIAFGLLAYVGTNMIREALSKEDKDEFKKKDPTKGFSLIMLSVATSIDAFAVGISLSLLKLSIAFPVLIIGVVAMLFTLFGLYLGKKAASFSIMGKTAEVMGGLVLWAIGLKILNNNGVFDRFLY